MFNILTEMGKVPIKHPFIKTNLQFMILEEVTEDKDHCKTLLPLSASSVYGKEKTGRYLSDWLRGK